MGIMTRTGGCWRCLILGGDNQFNTTMEGEGVMMAAARTAVMAASAIVVKVTV